jgi:hypothetical protein
MRNWMTAAMVLVFLAAFAGAAAAAGVQAPADVRDQALAGLGQPVLSSAPQACRQPAQLELAAPPPASCINLFCQQQVNCASCPGGLSAWYCALDVHRCVPF